MQKIVLGTRGSALAIAQTESVKDHLLRSSRDISVDVAIIKTLGDRKQGTPQSAESDKKDWIVDLEQALQRGEIDIAIHCGKDVPGELESGTTIRPILKRAHPWDVFIGKRLSSGQRLSFRDLPRAAVVGTASLRRRASLQAYRSDLLLRDHRGNVPTRIEKLDASSDLSGVVLAAAGLQRLNVSNVATEMIDRSIMLPAMNQGILVAQLRGDDHSMNTLIDPLVDQAVAAEFAAERAVSEVLGGDCHSAISIFAEVAGDTITVEARVLSIDGREVVKHTAQGARTDAALIGFSVGEVLLNQGADKILAAQA